jgi:hypothetical protein
MEGYLVTIMREFEEFNSLRAVGIVKTLEEAHKTGNEHCMTCKWGYQIWDLANEGMRVDMEDSDEE